MANTLELISSVAVGSGGASSIDFTSIPSTFTDLQIVFSIRTNAGTSYQIINYSYNGSTSSRTVVRMEGYGTGTPTSANTGAMFGYMANGNGSTSNVFGSGVIYIPNYAGSNNKSSSAEGGSENNATETIMGLAANLWSNTAAINQVTLTPTGGTTILQYSTAYLYGIKSS